MFGKLQKKPPSHVPLRVTVTKEGSPGLLVFLVEEALFLPPHPFCSPFAHILRAQTWKIPSCLHWIQPSLGFQHFEDSG